MLYGHKQKSRIYVYTGILLFLLQSKFFTEGTQPKLLDSTPAAITTTEHASTYGPSGENFLENKNLSSASATINQVLTNGVRTHNDSDNQNISQATKADQHHRSSDINKHTLKNYVSFLKTKHKDYVQPQSKIQIVKFFLNQTGNATTVETEIPSYLITITEAESLDKHLRVKRAALQEQTELLNDKPKQTRTHMKLKTKIACTPVKRKGLSVSGSVSLAGENSAAAAADAIQAGRNDAQFASAVAMAWNGGSEKISDSTAKISEDQPRTKVIFKNGIKYLCKLPKPKPMPITINKKPSEATSTSTTPKATTLTTTDVQPLKPFPNKNITYASRKPTTTMQRQTSTQTTLRSSTPHTDTTTSPEPSTTTQNVSSTTEIQQDNSTTESSLDNATQTTQETTFNQTTTFSTHETTELTSSRSEPTNKFHQSTTRITSSGKTQNTESTSSMQSTLSHTLAATSSQPPNNQTPTTMGPTSERSTGLRLDNVTTRFHYENMTTVGALESKSTESINENVTYDFGFGNGTTEIIVVNIATDWETENKSLITNYIDNTIRSTFDNSTEASLTSITSSFRLPHSTVDFSLETSTIVELLLTPIPIFHSKNKTTVNESQSSSESESSEDILIPFPIFGNKTTTERTLLIPIPIFPSKNKTTVNESLSSSELESSEELLVSFPIFGKKSTASEPLLIPIPIFPPKNKTKVNESESEESNSSEELLVSFPIFGKRSSTSEPLLMPIPIFPPKHKSKVNESESEVSKSSEALLIPFPIFGKRNETTKLQKPSSSNKTGNESSQGRGLLVPFPIFDIRTSTEKPLVFPFPVFKKPENKTENVSSQFSDEGSKDDNETEEDATDTDESSEKDGKELQIPLPVFTKSGKDSTANDSDKSDEEGATKKDGTKEAKTNTEEPLLVPFPMFIKRSTAPPVPSMDLRKETEKPLLQIPKLLKDIAKNVPLLNTFI